MDKAQYEAVPGRVSFPKIMYMTEVEKQDALHKLRTTDDLEAKDPFLFIFTQQEDMEVFLQGCVDQQHLPFRPCVHYNGRHMTAWVF